ncbi:protein NLP6 [Cryptomeria japonica]|uniref:protein NLP6 n=1 Tax=Cryptomeria japonica TaxID=3369 RepID=UPI0027D9D182|nr:protein NLP6 [Cryptomeria japonica]XP_057839421.2 protein NLP6 [Cryptomeria japonica]XP_057839422.2 protein NLP6 [Cryptomeria japonica]XP_057839423.2 protein NLP6 [Cryptomeria japonica]XP_057839424.2 protein NLP6 [Cryptomeria japonica]
MDSSSFKGITQPGSREMDENVAVPELMDLDPFGDSLAVGSWMEDCGDMEFAEMSPNSSASFFNAPFFSLFSFPTAENSQLVQDQRLQSNDVKNQEQKVITKDERALESNPVFSGSENDTYAARQDPFVRMEGFLVRNEVLKSNPIRESDFQQLMDSGMPEKSFTRSNDEQNDIRMAPGSNNDDLASSRSEQENDALLRAVRTYDGPSLLKERMTQALRYIKAFSGSNVLAQVWVPIKKNGKRVLTTYGQPYALDPGSDKLINFRTVSLKYEFSTDENSDEGLGIPGRVFLRKLPEWTPNVQYYSSKEYPRIIHAQDYNVRGSLALPVFEPENQTCIGVVELIMTAQKIHYAPEVENVCRALESVNLRSSEFLDHQKLQIYNESRQAVLPEILEILTAVCQTHKLPLAQTWVPCRHRNVSTNGDDKKGSCIDIDGHSSGRVCMSTIAEACYVPDPQMFGFQEACSEQHLLKGQGVPGKALESNQPYFSADITTFSKMEYPLLHYARMFFLRAAVAIRLRSTLASNDDYVVEFFLPVDCKDFREQQLMLNSLSTTMQSVCRSLRTVSDREVEEERLLEITDECQTGKNNLEDELLIGEGKTCLTGPLEQEWKQQGSLQQPMQNIQNEITQPPAAKSPSAIDYERHDSAQVDNGNAAACSVGEPTSFSPVKENLNIRKRGKAEKNISLEVLRQYFAGSLKDAAKSIGVCPTTLKRICRQHGISRWPSRKISKVNRSIKKLQIVIESVQGVEGAFKLGPFINGSFSPTLSNTRMRNSPLVQGNSCTADMKGATSHPENKTSTQGQEVRSCAQTSLEKCCDVSEELSVSQSLMTAGLGTSLPSVLACKEKPGNHAYSQISTPEICATPMEGSFMQMTGHYRRGLDSSMGGGTSNSSECSQNSNSSQHCSNEVDPNDQVASYQFATPQTCQENEQINGQKEQFTFPVVKRAHSEKLLDNRSEKVPVRSSSYKCLDSAPNEPRNTLEKGKCVQECSKPSPLHVSFNESSFLMNPNDPELERLILAGRLQTGGLSEKDFTLMTVKATYKEDTVRFKFSQHMGFQEVREGVAKRFQLELGMFNLRYIDDDSEWVLLTCDADLSECIDIFKSSGSRTIKLLVQDVCPNIGSSCGSTGGL